QQVQRRSPEDHARLHRVQGAQLHHQEEPAQRPRPHGAEEVLPALPAAPPATRLTSMPVDQSLVGREFPPTQPYRVSAEKVRELADATGSAAGPVPATFPIVMAFEAMNTFLEDVGVELQRIVHGEQRFAYERPITVR